MRRIQVLVVLALIASMAGCRSGLPEPGSEEYIETVSSFYTGIAALQVGEDRHAEEQLLHVVALAPDEPAAWANLGLLALRRNELDLAEERLRTAETLVPENSRIAFLLGVVDATRGDVDAAIAHFERSRELDAENIKAIYALIEQVQQRGGAGAAEQVRSLIDTILQVDPDNLAILVERARLAALAGDREELDATLESLEEFESSWSQQSREQLDAAQEAAASGDLQETGTQISFLSNVLKREAAYRESLASVRTQPGRPDDLISQFIALPPPSPEPASPDDSLSFGIEPLFSDAGERDWAWARSVAFSAEGLPVVVAASEDEIIFEGGTTLNLDGAGDLGGEGVVPFDYNYDFRVDLALAGSDGLRIFRQEADSSFADVTAELGLPQDVLQPPYSGGWSVDVDLEGDLDLILAREDGRLSVLINRGDQTFEVQPFFQEVEDAEDFAWADLDADGDPDGAFAGADGSIWIYENNRSQGFTHRVVDANARALTASDLNSDGIFELIVLDRSGAITGMQQAVGVVEAQQPQLATWPEVPAENATRIIAADIDNNGAIDLVASGGGQTAVWLSHGEGAYERLKAPTNADTYSAADVTGSGRLDLIGIGPDGTPVRLGNRGTMNYHSKSIHPRAAEATGDQRINPFGIGGEIEVRSGVLFQKQPISTPIVHFGLGEHLVVDVARIVWPNGDIQAEFDLLSDETVMARQRLKGSCPWLFTYDGEGMRFVTDFIWRSPLGLRINAQETAGVMMTEDWVKIDGSELVPKDGFYDVRITAELWETHFFDQVSLMVVDHPANTEMWIDERFVFPPPEMKVYATGPSHPVLHVRDDSGRDVTEYVTAMDENYLASFDTGQYQGVAEMHSITIDLSDAPSSGPLYLLASGWVRPTDSSINVAISQGEHEPPQGLRLDVPDGSGGWTTVHPNLGFPAGKHKTVLLDLTDIFIAEQQIRLTTNLEVYWDAISWAVGLPEADIRTTDVQAASVDLRYRGYSAVVEPDRSHPEVPIYDSLASTVQIWQDLIGYYTRFGEVRELLAAVDDRYVIMNAGDEMAFRFPVVEGPHDGWVRDYVLIGDGWVKDGDLNTTYSETVRPLPAHDLPNYSMPRVAIEEDEVYQRHPEDWKTYHTRYVTPAGVRTAMKE